MAEINHCNREQGNCIDCSIRLQPINEQDLLFAVRDQVMGNIEDGDPPEIALGPYGAGDPAISDAGLIAIQQCIETKLGLQPGAVY